MIDAGSILNGRAERAELVPIMSQERGIQTDRSRFCIPAARGGNAAFEWEEMAGSSLFRPFLAIQFQRNFAIPYSVKHPHMMFAIQQAQAPLRGLH